MAQFVWFLSFSSHIFAFLHMNINISYSDWSPLPILWLRLWALAALLPNQTLHPSGKEGKKGLMTFTSPTSYFPFTIKKRKSSRRDWPRNPLSPPFVAKDWTTCGKEGTKYYDDRIIFWTLCFGFEKNPRLFWLCHWIEFKLNKHNLFPEGNVIFRNATKIF